MKKYGIKRCVYVPNRSSPLVLVHWPNMWWTVSKGAANQSAFKVQNRQHEKKKKNKPILWLGAFGPSNYWTVQHYALHYQHDVTSWYRVGLAGRSNPGVLLLFSWRGDNDSTWKLQQVQNQLLQVLGKLYNYLSIYFLKTAFISEAMVVQIKFTSPALEHSWNFFIDSRSTFFCVYLPCDRRSPARPLKNKSI